MPHSRRVVVTGLGTVNPLANSVPGYWDALMSCQSGIAPITRFDTDAFDSRIGGEVKDWEDAKPESIDVRDWRHMDLFCQYAVVSAMEAVVDSGLDFTGLDPDRTGVVVGSGIGGLMEIETQHVRMLEKGPKRVSPFTVPKMMVNAASGTIAMIYGLQGPNFCVVTACASAAHSIGESARIIQRGEADIMLAGGSEVGVTKVGLASFCALKGLSTRNDDPTRASRPWDKDRDGFLLAEGAGVVVLEELEHAKARGAKIYGELTGYGSSCDAHHITAPDPEANGAILAVKRALADAEVNTDEVNYINAHGTSTGLGDLAEANGIKKVFGDHAYNGLMVSSTKSATGHLLGASAGIEIIACAKAIETGVLPATLNLDNPDEGCDLDFIPHTPRETKVDVTMSNSFGFGGHNACLVLRRFEG
jgi:3-oxoacyl-[acyl-carrier-protein] synthase II